MGHYQSCPAGPMGQQGPAGPPGKKGADGTNGVVITNKMRSQLLYLENIESHNCIMDAGYCTDDSNCNDNRCSITYIADYGGDCKKLLDTKKYTHKKIQCIDGYKQSVSPDQKKKSCVFTCVPDTL